MTQTDDARVLPDRIYACLSHASKTGVTVLLGHANQPVSGWRPYVREDLALKVTADPRVQELLGALQRIVEASDHYSNEADAENKGAETLAYAHKSTCNLARRAIAEFEGGNTDE